MSRVVTAPLVGAGSRRLLAASPDRLDPVVRELVERARAEAYDRGLREGEARGAAAAEAQVAERTERLRADLDRAVEAATAAVRAERDAGVGAAVELALAMARVVLGREPHDGGAAVAERVREALQRIEDPSPTVRVHPADAAALQAAVVGPRAVVVEADPALAPGEARIVGAWAEADLTHAAAFAAIRRDLGVDD